jgi:hypothetical protein
MLVQKVSDLLTEGQIGVGELQVHGSHPWARAGDSESDYTIKANIICIIIHEASIVLA